MGVTTRSHLQPVFCSWYLPLLSIHVRVPVVNANTQSAAPSLLSAQGEEHPHLSEVFPALLQDWTQGTEGYKQMAQLLPSPFPPTKVAGGGLCLPGGISLHCVVWVQVMVTRSRLGDGIILASPPPAGLWPCRNSRCDPGCLCEDPLVPHACPMLHSLFGPHQKVLGALLSCQVEMLKAIS